MINDRGMMKYQGFFMTEHSELLKEAKKDYYRVEKPVISQEQIEEFEWLIEESMRLGSELEFSIWIDGFIEEKVYQIKKIDHLNKKIHFQTSEIENKTFYFSDIVNIRDKSNSI